MYINRMTTWIYACVNIFALVSGANNKILIASQFAKLLKIKRV